MTGLHPSEEDLLLHFYGEGGEGTPVGDHLATCAECGRRFESWRATLRAVVDEPVPERGVGYGAQVWERLRPRLAEPAAVRPRARLWRPVVLSGAMAAALAAAFWAGRALKPGGAPAPPLPASARERILLLAVGDHLERSRLVLLELANANPRAPVDLSSQRGAAGQLVAASRLYRQTAQRAGEAGVASVLEDLERILVEVANGPDRLSPPEAEALQQRIERQGLLFKIRVMGTQVEGREKLPRDRHPGRGDVDL